MIDQLTKEEFMKKPQKCGYCQKFKRDSMDIENIYETGMCLSCDHSFVESEEDNRRDIEEMDNYR